jgi:hypothetical protein
VIVIVTSADVTFLHEHADELASFGATVIEKPFDINIVLSALASRLSASPDAHAG